MKRILFTILLFVVFCPIFALSEESIFQLVTEAGESLTNIAYEPEAGDRYLSSDNRFYTVLRVEGQNAVMRDDGAAQLPPIGWLNRTDTARAASAVMQKRLVALYCTHSDESYEPTDGYYSTTGRGSIYEIAQELSQALGNLGIEAEVADTLHHPHDAGAYRRSRQTAMQLVKSLPDALFDLHRDGIPDPGEYTASIGGKHVSRIRLLVGRGNQNMEVNETFALTMKAVGDQVYPGLVKDIYFGKGVFNQDLLPRALLFECGTYTLPREYVTASLPMLADVIDRTLYGSQRASAQRAGLPAAPRQENAEGDTSPRPLPGESSAALRSLWPLVLIFVLGLIVFGIAQTGSARGGLRKASRHLSEMTGGLVGKKPDDHEREQ